LFGLLWLGVAPAALSAVSEFGQTAVGSTSSANVAVALTAAQLAAGPTFKLHYGLDFSAGSCTPTPTGCNLAVTFAPKYAGSRADAVVVKSGSGSVLINVVVHGTGVGPLAGPTRPLASTLNAPYQAVTANASILLAGTSGDISVYSTDETDLVIDINGYFAPAGNGGLSFYTVIPCRALDTRSAGPPFTGPLDIDVEASECGVPASAQAVAANATVVPVSSLAYLSLWPQGESQPLVSTLNSGGSVVPNMAILTLNNGAVSAFATQSTQLVLDVFGYFAP
jgi:hypothetical protein